MTEDETPSSAAPGHFQVDTPFEVGIRRGVLLAAVGLTFTWVLWTVVDLSSFVLPLFNLPPTWEIEGWRTVQMVIRVLNLIPLFLGTVWLTRWPGPAREHKTTVRVLVVAGALGAFALQALISAATSYLDLGLNITPVLFQLVSLLGTVPLIAVAVFCALVVRDRGDPPLSTKMITLVKVYAGYEIVTALLTAIVITVGSGFALFTLLRIGGLIFLSVFLWLFTKTWRALV